MGRKKHTGGDESTTSHSVPSVTVTSTMEQKQEISQATTSGTSNIISPSSIIPVIVNPPAAVQTSIDSVTVSNSRDHIPPEVKYIVGIDFGTSRTGYAWNEVNGTPESVRCQTKWRGKKKQQSTQ